MVLSTFLKNALFICNGIGIGYSYLKSFNNYGVMEDLRVKNSVAILVIFCLGLFSPKTFAQSAANVNKDGVLLNGYDVVSYFKSAKPTRGLAQFQVNRDGAIYWFSNPENKQAFLSDPPKYEPQFGGWCAYAVADSSSKVEVDPTSYVIQDGRLLLFYNGIWSDTRDKWLHTKNKDSKIYLKEADAHWPEVKSKKP